METARRRESLVPALGLLGFLLVAPAAIGGDSRPEDPDPFARGPHAVQEKLDLAYRKTPAGSDERRSRLDLFLPAPAAGRPSKHPLLVFAHGGAWKFGSKDLYRDLGRRMAAVGIAAANVNYRLTPPAKHPDHVRDLAASVRWLVDRSGEYSLRKDRLFLMGHSAGAHLVTLAALDPSYLNAVGLSPGSVRGVIGVSGPYALGPGSFEDVFGAEPAERRRAFPLFHTRDVKPSGLPSFLLLAADQDFPLLADNARAMTAALKARGVKAEEKIIPGRTHLTIIGDFHRPGDPAGETAIQFMKRLSH